jgi:hypothetical protein
MRRVAGDHTGRGLARTSVLARIKVCESSRMNAANASAPMPMRIAACEGIEARP